jgi:hypothetical protein
MKKRIFVIHADGTVISRQSHNSHGGFEKLKLLPGDVIVVPEKLKVSSKMNDFCKQPSYFANSSDGCHAQRC